MAQHKVTAACVVAKITTGDGEEKYYYRDALLPAGVSAAEKKRLVEAGLVEVVEDEPETDDKSATAKRA